MTQDDILKLVAALDEAIGPDTRLCWLNRGAAYDWYLDENAQAALDQLRGAWRQYRDERPPQ